MIMNDIYTNVFRKYVLQLRKKQGEEPNKYLCFRSNPVNLIYSQCIYVVQLN